MKERLVVRNNYAKGYAHALFDIAKEEKKLKKYKEDAKIILESLRMIPKITSIFNSKVTSKEETIKIFKKAFKGISENIINFLIIMSNKKSFNLIENVIKKLIKLINEKLNLKEGIIYSTIKLNSLEQNKINKVINKKLKTKVELTNKIDLEIISGVKVVVGDIVIEDSIHSRLEELRYKLLGRGIW